MWAILELRRRGYARLRRGMAMIHAIAVGRVGWAGVFPGLLARAIVILLAWAVVVSVVNTRCARCKVVVGA